MKTDRIISEARVASGNALDQAGSLADQAAQSVDRAIKSTQNMASDIAGNVASTAQDIRNEAAPLAMRAADDAAALARRGVDGIVARSRQLQAGVQRASDGTRRYIKDEPVKAMLIAVAAGALLAGIARALSRGRKAA